MLYEVDLGTGCRALWPQADTLLRGVYWEEQDVEPSRALGHKLKREPPLRHPEVRPPTRKLKLKREPRLSHL